MSTLLRRSWNKLEKIFKSNKERPKIDKGGSGYVFPYWIKIFSPFFLRLIYKITANRNKNHYP